MREQANQPHDSLTRGSMTLLVSAAMMRRWALVGRSNFKPRGIGGLGFWVALAYKWHWARVLSASVGRTIDWSESVRFFLPPWVCR